MDENLENLLKNLVVSKSESDSKEPLNKLRALFPDSWFAFHPAAGLIVWWPHRNLQNCGPMPHAISHMASNIYLFDQDICHRIKDRNGMNFTVPKEVNILQALLS